MTTPALPAELWELIASFVDANTLSALRLTSRMFYDCTLETFTTKVTKRRWLLRAASLDTLRAAASNPHLRERLTTFRLGTHALTSWVERPDEPHWRDAWEAELMEQHLLTWRRRETNEPMGPGAALIADALHDLPALRRIEIGEWCTAATGFEIGHGGRQSRNGSAQYLDPAFRSAKMYTTEVLHDGRPELYIEEGDNMNQPRSRLSECFQHTLHALMIKRSEHNAQPLESLSALLYDGRTKTLRGILTDDMQKLKQGSKTFRALQPALADLRELSLAVEVDGIHWVYRKVNSRPETWLSVFLRLVPSLEVLQLFCIDRFGSGAYAVAFCYFLRDTCLERLARLELACARINGLYFEDFLHFWHRHASSLTHLTLTCVQLSAVETAESGWPIMLKKMSQLPLRLSMLRLQGLTDWSDILIFSESRGPWGCDECLLMSGRQAASSVNVPPCGHTSYESHTGQWPARETMRTCSRFDSCS